MSAGPNFYCQPETSKFDMIPNFFELGRPNLRPNLQIPALFPWRFVHWDDLRPNREQDEFMRFYLNLIGTSLVEMFSCWVETLHSDFSCHFFFGLRTLSTPRQFEFLVGLRPQSGLFRGLRQPCYHNSTRGSFNTMRLAAVRSTFLLKSSQYKRTLCRKNTNFQPGKIWTNPAKQSPMWAPPI